MLAKISCDSTFASLRCSGAGPEVSTSRGLYGGPNNYLDYFGGSLFIKYGTNKPPKPYCNY